MKITNKKMENEPSNVGMVTQFVVSIIVTIMK